VKRSPIKRKRSDKFKTRQRDPEKLAWVKMQPCLVCNEDCQGVVEAHHIHQERHDDEALPLCTYHHSELHVTLGKKNFLVRYALPDWRDLAAWYEQKFQEGK